jgi:hypothetical protein
MWYCRRCDRARLHLDVAALICSMLAYATNVLFLKPATGSAFVHGHLNDLFAMPFIIGYSNIIIRIGGRREWGLVTPATVYPFTLFCSLTWEYISPLVNPRATSDPLDILAYTAGSSAYLLLASYTVGHRNSKIARAARGRGSREEKRVGSSNP